MLEKGIQYIEIRSFDNNPYHASGLDVETLQFVHLFFLTMVSMIKKVSSEETEKGKKLKKLVAEEHPFSKTSKYDEGIWVLGEMQNLIEVLELEQGYSKLVDKALDQLSQPEKTISGKIILGMEEGLTLLALGEELGWKHKINIINKDVLPGFEHFSPERQEEIYEIIQKGQDLPSWIFEKA